MSPVSGSPTQQFKERFVDVEICPPEFGFTHQPRCGQSLKIFDRGRPWDAEIALDEFGFSIGMTKQIIQQVLAIELGQIAVQPLFGRLYQVTDATDFGQGLARGFFYRAP